MLSRFYYLHTRCQEPRPISSPAPPYYPPPTIGTTLTIPNSLPAVNFKYVPNLKNPVLEYRLFHNNPCKVDNILRHRLVEQCLQKGPPLRDTSGIIQIHND